MVKFAGELIIDFRERCLFYGAEKITLAKKEFEIIELLSQNPGQVFDKERIYERVWGYDSDGESSVVPEHIRRIRNNLAAYTQTPYIETVWGADINGFNKKGMQIVFPAEKHCHIHYCVLFFGIGAVYGHCFCV